ANVLAKVLTPAAPAHIEGGGGAPPPPIRPRVAVFTPAAPTPSTAVARRSPNCEQCETGSSSPATCTICRRRKILWLQLARTEASVASLVWRGRVAREVFIDTSIGTLVRKRHKHH